MNIKEYKYIYFIGIGGVGMSALARFFYSKEINIYGYDAVRSQLCKELELEGINIHYKADIKNIPLDIRSASNRELLVIYTPAVSLSNIEIQFFINKGMNIYKRAEVLGMISDSYFTIAIAGTHGKTTTTTILSHLLKNSGKRLLAFLGGISNNYQTNILVDNNPDILLIEADEYDRSFLQLKPDIAIITSVDADHLDIYNTPSEIENAFIQFASQVKEKGVLFVEESIKINFPIPKRGFKRTFSSIEKADYYANNINMLNGKSYFESLILDIEKNDRNHLSYEIEFLLPGEHNISNVLAAIAVCSYLELDIQKIIEGVRTFSGIKRRFEVLVNNQELVFIDDYAHHPEEIRFTINTVRELFPERMLTVIFQPHLFSRTKDFADQFALSLSLADQLILLDIYAAREEPITGIDSEMLLSLCSNSVKELCSKNQLLNLLENREIDVLLTLGAGDIGGITDSIKHLLN